MFWWRCFTVIGFVDFHQFLGSHQQRRYRHWITVSTVGGSGCCSLTPQVRYVSTCCYVSFISLLYYNIPMVRIKIPLSFHDEPNILSHETSFIATSSIIFSIWFHHSSHSFISNPILSSHSHSIPLDPSKSIHFSIISKNVSSKPQNWY